MLRNPLFQFAPIFSRKNTLLKYRLGLRHKYSPSTLIQVHRSAGFIPHLVIKIATPAEAIAVMIRVRRALTKILDAVSKKNMASAELKVLFFQINLVSAT